jgi:hypothetical protein
MASLALVVLAAGCGSGDEQGAQAVETADPVATFAPLVQLHRGEESFPLSTELALRHSTLEWMGSKCGEINVAAGVVSQERTGEGAPRLVARRLGHPPAYRVRPYRPDCDGRRKRAALTTSHTRPFDAGRRPRGIARDEGFYLDILILDDAGRKLERRGDQHVLVGAPVYYERARTGRGGQRGLRLSYWMLYPDAEIRAGDGSELIVREGDWQKLEVILRPANGRNGWLPIAVRYHAGDDVREVPWKDVARAGDTGDVPATHPVAFAALRSHVMYPDTGRHERTVRSGVDGRPATAVEETEQCAACPIWRTWEHLRSARHEPWYGFGGGWGVRHSNDDNSGPLGPSPWTTRSP